MHGTVRRLNNLHELKAFSNEGVLQTDFTRA